MPPRPQHALAAGAVGLVVAALGFVAVRPAPPDAPPVGAWAEAVRSDTLARYLDPVEEPAPHEGEPGFEAPLYAFAEPAPQAVRAAPRPAPRERRVSAILIVGDRRVAIIDETAVGEGDRLSDGARVLSVGPNRVVILEPSGARTALRL